MPEQSSLPPGSQWKRSWRRTASVSYTHLSESIQYVRSYVEDAGTAIYDTIPKKPTARESIRDKLKSAQKAQPPHTPKPQKSKGKDMEL